MIRVRILIVAAMLLTLAAAPAEADWLDDYEAGLKAAQSGQWSVVVQKMSAAIKARPKENARERTTGTGFIAYHPYYYRGLANVELGNLEAGIEDLRKATGQGSVKLGAPDSILGRAEMQLARQSQPEVPTTTVAQQPPIQQPVTPTTTVTQQPQIDPNLAPARSRAREALTAARDAHEKARRARAGSQPEFADGERLMLSAQQDSAQADTASDWIAVEKTANRALSTLNLAITKNQIAQQKASKEPTTAKVATAATEDALSQKRQRVRAAVEAYFSGDFTRSIQAFDRLANEERENSLLWAFLGASHYYNWYLSGQTNDREEQAAIDAFRKARQHGNGRLDSNYFPKRVQNFFATVQ
ncbi:MAG: hypothetical protein ABR524_00075 [Thermoanaerobaculia bacterium]